MLTYLLASPGAQGVPGGWLPVFIQGVAASFLGGIMAAWVAVVTIRVTFLNERQQQREVEARAAVRLFIEAASNTLGKFADSFEEDDERAGRRHRQRAANELVTAIHVHLSAVAVHDEPNAGKLLDQADDLRKLANEAIGLTRENCSESMDELNEMLVNISAYAADLMISWRRK
ncbi:hypothetical protein [Herbidospora sp. RD11066]